MNRTPALLKDISNKVWQTTIKIPELKTAVPAFESSFDQDEVAERLTEMFQKHKGQILVVTGAGENAIKRTSVSFAYTKL